jgi:hypothetical protein
VKTHALAVLAWVVSVGFSAALLGLAACGGENQEDKATTTVTATGTAGLELPADLSDEQKAAILQIPNLADDANPLATLVSHKALAEDEIRATIEGDDEFVELETLATSVGFGSASAGVELQYDNDIKVTAALLDSPKGGLALAMREAGPTAMYVVFHLASDGKTITEYNREGTVTLDIETLTGSAVDSPDAQHSCRTGHCIYAALNWLFDSWYGTVVKKVCKSYISAIIALPATAGASAVLTIPSCIACIPGLAAPVIASAYVCEDDPCMYCADNTCGDPPMSHDEYCVSGIGPPDPVTGISASVTGADTGYYCDGITQNWDGTDDLSGSECRYSSESTGIVRACPYGCADPPPGDTRSRDCLGCITDANCPSDQIIAGPTCFTTISLDPSGAGEVRNYVRTEYRRYRCQSGQCVASGGVTEQPCQWGCSADRKSCAPVPPSCQPANCEREDEPFGDSRCVLRPDDQKWILERDYQHWECNPVQGGYNSTCEQTVITKLEQECPAGCAADGKSCLSVCNPSTCDREEDVFGSDRCVYSYSEGYIIERTVRKYFCSPLSGGGSTCDSSTYVKTARLCPYGCNDTNTWCGAGPGGGLAPAAPSNFIALQHPDGTEFEWADNSNNEDGFHIYFGAKSLGRPSTLIATAGADTTSIDTTHVRSGSEICWEIYAYNAYGESAPAWYCLPP